MTLKTLRIATRKSPLALWQATFVGQALQKFWPDLCVELVPMRTSGDKFLKNRLQAVGGKGLFVKELEEAVLENRADCAVHSMKDVPAAFPDGLSLPVICTRADPRDVLVSPHFASIQDLPEKAVIGTASLRRGALLLASRPDVQIQSLRGNIQTRLAEVEKGAYQGIILALAGLERMGLTQYIREILSEDLFLPACGQGALGIECRSKDARVLACISVLNDPLSLLCVATERKVNQALGGNCHVPVAVYCKPIESGQLSLRARVLSVDGKTVLNAAVLGPKEEADAMAKDVANALFQQGATALLSPYA